MPVVVVYVPGFNRQTAATGQQSVAEKIYLRAGHPRVRIDQEPPGRETITLPVAPNQIGNTQLSPGYVEYGGTGTQPRLYRGQEQLHVVRLPLLLIGRDDEGGVDVEEQLRILRALARDRHRVRIGYGRSEQGWWRITDLSWDTETRVFGSNDIGEATCTVELTRAWNADVSAKPPVDQAVTTTPPPPAAPVQPPSQPDGRGGGPARRYTVKSGDTLARIAAQELGDANGWQAVADLNRITDPRRLEVGQVLLIPVRLPGPGEVLFEDGSVGQPYRTR